MIPSFIINIFAFILALGILISFHEFGHFWVARRCGVKVLCFSIGFGKSLWRWFGKDGTEYKIGMIPLGGYVKMLGEKEELIAPEDRSQAFNQKSVWARTAIVAAGPIFNFIFAFFAYWAMSIMGTQGIAPLIGELKTGSIAEQAGLKSNLEIISIDGKSTETWQDVLNGLVPRIGDQGTLKLSAREYVSDKTSMNEHAGAKDYFLALNNWDVDNKDPDLIGALGIIPFRPQFPAIVGEIIEGGAAMKAGLMPNDQILAVDNKPIANWMALVAEISKRPNIKAHLSVLREGKNLELMILPTAKTMDDGKVSGQIGVMIKSVEFPKDLIRTQKYSALESLSQAYDKTVYYTSLSFKLIGKLMMGKISPSNLSGPISIAQGAGATIQIGFSYYIGFLALISISLGVVNLLPVPMLDGGHLLFYAFEIITRRPVPEKVQQIAINMGLLFIIGLMSLSFYNDIVRLIG